MFNLEVKIMLFSIWTETNLFDNNLYGFRLDLLLLLLLFVLEFRIINNFANRRISIWRYLNQIKILLLCQLDRLLNRVDINFDVFADNPYPGCCYPFVYTIRLFWLLGTPSAAWAIESGSAAVCVDTVKI
jgi:hypothetical protein